MDTLYGIIKQDFKAIDGRLITTGEPVEIMENEDGFFTILLQDGRRTAPLSWKIIIQLADCA